MAEEEKTVIYRIEASCSIKDTPYEVTALTLDSQLSSLSEVTIALAGKTASKGTVTVASPETIFALLSEISKYEGKSVVSLDVTVTEVKQDGTLGKVEQIKIANWILKGAGLSDFSASGSLGIAISVVHPAYMLLATSLTTNSCYGVTDIPPSVSPENVFDAAWKAINHWALMQTTLPSDAVDQESRKLIKQMQDRTVYAVYLGDNMFKWKAAASFPLAIDAQDKLFGSKLCDELYKSLKNHEEGSFSIWSFLVDNVLRDFHLCAVPEWDGTVSILDYSPWRKASYTIPIGNVSQLPVSPSDPSPVYSVRLLRNNVALPNAYVSTYSNSADVNPTASSTSSLSPVLPYSLFVSDPAGTGLGAAVDVYAPGWFNLFALPAIPPKRDIYSENNSSADTNPAVLELAIQEELVQLSKYGNKVAMAEFYSLCKQSVSFAFVTKLLLDEQLLPGIRISITEFPEVSGFVNKVTHVIDVSQNLAYTSIRVAYVSTGKKGRAEEQLLDTVNPFYA